MPLVSHFDPYDGLLIGYLAYAIQRIVHIHIYIYVFTHIVQMYNTFLFKVIMRMNVFVLYYAAPFIYGTVVCHNMPFHAVSCHGMRFEQAIAILLINCCHMQEHRADAKHKSSRHAARIGRVMMYDTCIHATLCDALWLLYGTIKCHIMPFQALWYHDMPYDELTQ